MGIEDFYNALKEWCPHVLVETSFDALTGYRVAVDISIFLCKYVKSFGPVAWIDSFIILLCTLKSNGMKAVCIFDGPNPPPEKLEEQTARREATAKTVSKMNECKRLLKIVKTQYIEKNKTKLSDSLIAEIRALMTKNRRVLDTINYSDVQDVAETLGSKISKWEKQTLPITDEYKNKAKEIIAYMGMAQFQAYGEAEALCAWLAVNRHVDAVLSEDTDVLAYGSPMLFSKIDLTNKTVMVLMLEHILEGLNLELDEFKDFCILLGCDYNKRIKGFPPDGKKRKKAVNIGLKAAYCMISEYKTLERCEPYIEDIEPLIYPRCRELFSIPPIPPIEGWNGEDGEPDENGESLIPYSHPIDQENLKAFLERVKSGISLGYIMKSWQPPKLIFEEEEEVEVLSDEEAEEELLF